VYVARREVLPPRLGLRKEKNPCYAKTLLPSFVENAGRFVAFFLFFFFSFSLSFANPNWGGQNLSNNEKYP
jgi:hypothetical protein